MKKRVLMVLAILLILAGIFILVRVAANVLKPKGRGALQVNSNIRASVTLNGEVLGTTPLYRGDQNESLPEGLYDLKITPEDKNLEAYSAKVKINPGVLTAVERTFLPGSLASSYILMLEKSQVKNPQIFISSIPDNSLVSIDGTDEGVTPLNLPSISASEHEVEIQKEGFAKKTIRVRAVDGYKLVLNVVLSAGGSSEIEIAPSVSPTAVLTPIPPPNSITIKNTPTGFLRVRSTPSLAGTEIGRVTPSETYEVLEENASWVKIKLKDGQEGWVSKTYTQKNTQ